MNESTYFLLVVRGFSRQSCHVSFQGCTFVDLQWHFWTRIFWSVNPSKYLLRFGLWSIFLGSSHTSKKQGGLTRRFEGYGNCQLQNHLPCFEAKISVLFAICLLGIDSTLRLQKMSLSVDGRNRTKASWYMENMSCLQRFCIYNR